jgi:hypothetical protein
MPISRSRSIWPSRTLRTKTEAVAGRAQSKWAQLKADAAAKVDDMKARAAKQADQLDADAAEVEAEWAEVDALDAISYASWTVGRGLPRSTRSTPGTRPTNWPPAPPHNGWTPRHGVSRLC